MTVDDERVIRTVHDDNASPVDELYVTRIDWREAEQLAMHLQESRFRFEVRRTGQSEVSPFELGELVVAVSGRGVCNKEAVVVGQAKPA